MRFEYVLNYLISIQIQFRHIMPIDNENIPIIVDQCILNDLLGSSAELVRGGSHVDPTPHEVATHAHIGALTVDQGEAGRGDFLQHLAPVVAWA